MILPNVPSSIPTPRDTELVIRLRHAIHMPTKHHLQGLNGFVILSTVHWLIISNDCFYRAMHFSAKRGIAIACRLSVRLSVCLSVCLSVTLVNCDHMGWNSSKIISPLVSLGCSLFATPTRRVCSKGNTPKFSPE